MLGSRYCAAAGYEQARAAADGRLSFEPLGRTSAEVIAELDLLLNLALLAEQRDVLRLRYGIDDGNAKSCAAVGSIMGIPTRQVRKTEQKALEALRRPHFISRLEEFLDVDL